MKILMVTAELAPFAKVGGLADAVSSLSKALVSAGHSVRACLPFYAEGRDLPDAGAVAESVYDLELPLRPPRKARVRVRPGPAPLDALLLVEDPERFARPGIYGDPRTGQGYADNGDRWLVLSAAAAAWAVRPLDGFAPDVIHCHDHQAGLVPAFLGNGGPGFRAERAVGTVFTIHNLGYQGIYGPDLFARTGLDPHLMRPLGPLEFHGRLNFMKSGIALAGRLTTVSPTYAVEICTPELGEGLDGLLRERRRSLTGILNGVDGEVWNPATDRLIPFRYSARSLAGKGKNRRALLEAFGLGEAPQAAPIIGMVSRLAPQKGFDLLLEGIGAITEMDLRLVVLGAGEQEYQDGLMEAARRHAGRIGVRVGFDERLAHLIEAGSDMFLMPSRYEPCGLNQMYSLLYGTVPVVRATGGLADTVVDLDEDPPRANGFVFRAFLPVELVKTVRRAVRAFGERNLWREMMLRGMASDFSWDRSASLTLEVYRAAAAEAQAAA